MVANIIRKKSDEFKWQKFSIVNTVFFCSENFEILVETQILTFHAPPQTPIPENAFFVESPWFFFALDRSHQEPHFHMLCYQDSSYRSFSILV